jgi:hypothetical protein
MAMTRSTRAIHALITLVAICLVVSACAGVESPGATPEGEPTQGVQPSPSSDSPASSDLSPSADAAGIDDRVIAEIGIGGGPDQPTEAFGAIWVLAPDGDIPAVYRVDPITNEVVSIIELPGSGCQGLGASPEAIWACSSDGMLRIDPETDEIVAEVPYDSPAFWGRLAYGAGTMWGVSTSGVVPDSLVRIDPATNTVTATIPLPGTVGSIAFGHEALWATIPADDKVLRIDPATNTVAEHATGVEGAHIVAVGPDALWVSLHGFQDARPGPDEATLVRIDPIDGSVLAEIATGGGIWGGEVAASANAVWVRSPQPFLVRIDPATNEIVERIDNRASEGSMLLTEDSLWVTSLPYGRVWRLDPT